MDNKLEKCIFVGNDSHHKGYRLYSPSIKAVIISRDVKFNEVLDGSSSSEFFKDSSKIPKWLDISSDKSPQEQNSSTQRITISMTLNKSFLTKINNHNEPSTFKEASKHACWLDAMKLEYEVFMKNGT